jgi:hypothetical protein
MKTLSAASRKSSSGVSSMSSPRPSITGALNYQTQNNAFVADTRMTSVDEEADTSNNNLLCTNIKLKDPRVCNERSDSGFSECSNCSTPSASCVCNNPAHIEKSDTIVEEQNSSSSNSTSTIEPAEESHTISSDHDVRSEISSLEFDENIGGGDRTNCDNGSGSAHDEEDIVLSIRVPTRRELFQNEFGVPMSEIERRKVSLENDSAKKKKKTTTSDAAREEFSLEKLKKSSKVSLLMEKFECKAPVTNDGESSPSSPTNSLDVVVFVDEMCDLAKNATNHASNNSFLSTAKCPSPAATRKSTTNQTTTFRLSDRVREVTERLSKPKQLAATGEKTTKTGILTKQNSNFVRSKEFWKR